MFTELHRVLPRSHAGSASEALLTAPLRRVLTSPRVMKTCYDITMAPVGDVWQSAVKVARRTEGRRGRTYAGRALRSNQSVVLLQDGTKSAMRRAAALQ